MKFGVEGGGIRRFTGRVRLLWIFVILAVLVLIPFAIWGEFFQTLFTQEGAEAWLREWGPWAGVAGVVLLIADLFLPIPGTVVISALGFVYGTWIGGLLGALGSALSGLLAYGLCRKLGRKAAVFVAGREDLEKGEHLFGGAAGGFIIALSRWLPVLPEVVACLAGMTKMPFGRFAASLACGSVPLGFAFAAIGAAGHGSPALAISLSAIVPAFLWAVVRPMVMRHSAATKEG